MSIDPSEYAAIPPTAKNLPPITCYLSGPIEYAAQQDSEGWWVEYANELAKLNIQAVSPWELGDKTKEADLHNLKQADTIDQYITLMRQIIAQDLGALANCDMMVAHWEGEKISGTVGEAQDAYLQGIPSYLVTKIPREQIPGWFLACFTEVFESLCCLMLFLMKQSFYRVAK